MSGLNISYEIANAGGEIAYFEGTQSEKKEPPNLANVIAGEIVNEILENALNIATQASDTGIHWKEVKKSNSIQAVNTPLASIPNNMKSAKMHLEFSDVVGDIVDAVETSPANIGEIIDGLNKISVNQDTPREQDVGSLDLEMKKLLSEMLSPPYEIVNYDTVPVKGGVGDQPYDDKSEGLTADSAEPEVSRTVEKKSRVTDLVKNAPHIISEYLMMDKDVKQNQEEWEESEERLVQVIELDCVKPGEEMFKVKNRFSPEKVALPIDDDEDELVQMPADDVMDIVDLSSEAFKNEERQLFSGSTNGAGAQGDEYKGNSLTNDVSPTETGSSGGITLEHLTSCSEDRIDGKSKDVHEKETKIKKKKWSIGTKLWGFLKKGHKQQEKH